jgi:hypothetical protein
MMKRLRRLIKLSKKDAKVLDKLTDEQIDALPDAPDGHAVFIGQGTEADYAEQEREDKGFKHLFGIGRKDIDA